VSSSISIAMHHVRIRRVRVKEFDQIDCFGDDDDDLFEVLRDILAGLKGQADNNQEAQQVLEIANFKASQRQISV